MSNKKVTRIPVTWHKRLKNKLGRGSVPCMYTERWLKFPEQSEGHTREGEYINLEVMTMGLEDKPRLICGLTITRENLLEAIKWVKSPDNKDE